MRRLSFQANVWYLRSGLAGFALLHIFPALLKNQPCPNAGDILDCVGTCVLKAVQLRIVVCFDGTGAALVPLLA